MTTYLVVCGILFNLSAFLAIAIILRDIHRERGTRNLIRKKLTPIEICKMRRAHNQTNGTIRSGFADWREKN